jgi:LPXTG-site transpeptidase (sortase) family protein
MNSAKITLDDPVFAGRLRYVRRGSNYVKRPMSSPSRVVSDIFIKPAPVAAVPDEHREPQLAKPQEERPELARLSQQESLSPEKASTGIRRSKQLYALYIMAAVVFLSGLAVSFKGWQANHKVAAQVDQLQKTSVSSSKAPDTSNESTPPSTTKPQALAVSSYSVPPEQPRYIDIPSLGVHARILRVGINGSGELGTPDNVFDAAWYSGSAKPGQNGAMLIDGHVSSWTTHGVFYSLKDLKSGNIIKVQRGDGKVFQYKVVKSQVYQENKVDMKAALAPVNSDKPGLNLITCAGQVKSGTSEFTQRIIVFTEQI